MPTNTARVWNTGTPENPIFNFELPSGAKGEPGGWNFGTLLTANTDLNTVTAPGLYQQTNSPLAAERLALNYPPTISDVNGSIRAGIRVYPWGGSKGAIIQEYINIGVRNEASFIPMTTWRRHNYPATEGVQWSPWTVIAPDRSTTDANGFKVMQTWDEVSNSWVSLAGPGGITQGGNLTTLDLNAVTTPGVYYQKLSGWVTAANNYPSVGNCGSLTVTNWGTGADGEVVQQYTCYPNQALSITTFGAFVRTRRSGAWSPWRAYALQRVDDTAGRAIYTWDDVSSREQMIYGDSGVRNIIAAIAGQSTAASDPSVLIHRNGNLVTLIFENLQPATSADWTPFTSLPAGFRPRLRNPHRFFITASNLGEQRSMFLYTSGAMTIFGAKNTDVIRSSITYPTVDPWPTSLPGTAI